MKKSFLFLFTGLITICLFGNPDEGMWLPNKIAQLNYGNMQKLGCKLTAEEIYSINNSSLKDAIFQLQNGQGVGFCTGEIVSKQGLLFTNHHCGYEAITKLSSTENNYLDNGYWAKNLKEEISVPDFQVSRVVRIEDVTSIVLKDITTDTKESDRNKTIMKAIKDIEKKATDGTHYKASVSEMYQGGEYYLFVYEVFGDVRFVGAPPSSIGKFGGDTDNWMWPRHTGDFSVFRVYMTPDGKPTEKYDANNVPYVPLHSLPISIKELNEGDFTMIMGYPGQTERYLSSYGMLYKRDYFNPAIVTLFGTQLDVQKVDMESNIEIKLALADSYASSANAYKLLKGQANTLSTTDAIQQREQLQNDFQKWVLEDEARTKKYGTVLNDLKNSYEKLGPAAKEMLYTSYGLLMSGQNVMKAQSFMGLSKLLEKQKDNADAINATIENQKKDSEQMFQKYFVNTDKKVFIASLNVYLKDIPAEKRNTVFNDYIFKTFKGKTETESIEKFADAVYSKSIFTDKARMDAFLSKPNLKSLKSDPIFAFVEKVFSNIMPIQMAYSGAVNGIDAKERLFIEGLREFQKDNVFYPDANSTLRLTYGTVKSYYPRDGVHYKYMTYADGILEKEDPTNDEFIVPKELKELVNKKQYGQYADKNGNLPVCFLSDNDITGGNSGSPILNGDGHLIGLAFDGNWEWLCSDLIFSEKLERTINVDSRYVLWVIGELYGAKNIIDELDIRK